jgi:hypothetical protein
MAPATQQLPQHAAQWPPRYETHHVRRASVRRFKRAYHAILQHIRDGDVPRIWGQVAHHVRQRQLRNCFAETAEQHHLEHDAELLHRRTNVTQKTSIESVVCRPTVGMRTCLSQYNCVALRCVVFLQFPARCQSRKKRTAPSDSTHI